MNRLEIDVLKLMSTDIWGGEGGDTTASGDPELRPAPAIPAPVTGRPPQVMAPRQPSLRPGVRA